ncbi:MAG: hypothetical protein V7609_2888 [Verrucomicrobiota bacterium]
MATLEDYALVVGIDDYKNPPYGPLLGAKRDATDFITWLKDPAGGNVPEKNIDPFTKLSDEDGSEPDLSDMIELLMLLRKRAPKGKKIGRRLYLFFSGHGVSPKGELDEAGLVTVDAQDSLDAFLPGKQSADQLTETARFDEVLLFMDCCRVSHLLLDPFKIPINEKSDAAAQNVKRFYAFATGYGNTAREKEHGGVMRGIFSRILIDGLKSAPTNAQGQRTTTQLRTYLQTEMAKETTLDGEKLVPKFPAADDEIVLAEGLAPKMSVVHLTLTQPTAGVEVLDGGNNFTPVQPSDVTTPPGGMRFTLPMGKGYVIRDMNSARMTIIKTDQEEIHESL